MPKLEKQEKSLNDNKAMFKRISERLERKIAISSEKMKKYKREMKSLIEKSDLQVIPGISGHGSGR